MWNEFKKFAFKGNVLDMAVGVIIGSAFGKIVTSLVNDVIMPVIGVMTAGVDFKDLKWVISAAVVQGDVVKPEAAILYGNFIQNVVDFLIVAASIFFFVRMISKLRISQKKEEESVAQAKGPSSEELLMEIRDLLKKEQSK